MTGNETTLSPGEEVVKAAGELHATAVSVSETVQASGVDHEEVQGWITTIVKAILAAFK